MSLDLKKVAAFIDVAEKEINTLRDKVAILEDAQDDANLNKQALDKAIEKSAANLLDVGFISPQRKDDFIKRAKENAVVLTQIINNLCDAHKVASFGKPASVTITRTAKDDPIAARAFGYGDEQIKEIFEE